MNKKHKIIADSLISGIPPAISGDALDAIIDRKDVREYILENRDRKLFLAQSDAVRLISETLSGKTKITPAQSRAIEFLLKGMKPPVPHQNNKTTAEALAELIDPEPVKN